MKCTFIEGSYTIVVKTRQGANNDKSVQTKTGFSGTRKTEISEDRLRYKEQDKRNGIKWL